MTKFRDQRVKISLLTSQMSRSGAGSMAGALSRAFTRQSTNHLTRRRVGELLIAALGCGSNPVG